MAAHFVTGTTVLSYAGMPDLSSTNWTISFWALTESTASNQDAFTTGSNSGVWLRFSGTNTLLANVDLTTTDKAFNGSLDHRRHWAHFLVRNLDYTSLNGSTVEVTVDGVKSSTGATNGTGTVVAWSSTWCVGNRSSGARPFAGRLAQFGVWDRNLTSSEALSLAYGATPTDISSGLRFAPSLSTDFFDPVSGQHAAVSGTVFLAEDPPQIQEQRTARIYRFAPPAASGVTIPVFRHHYVMQGIG